MCGFCNAWVYVCVGFVMCGCVVKCVLVFTVLYCMYWAFVLLFYVYLFLFVTSVRTAATFAHTALFLTLVLFCARHRMNCLCYLDVRFDATWQLQLLYSGQ